MKKFLVIVILLIIVSGCGDKKISANIQMRCDDLTTDFEVKKGNVINCNIQDNNYEFKIKSIKDDKIILESNNYDLTDDKNINKEINSFSLNKDKELSLYTKVNQDNIIISWK